MWTDVNEEAGRAFLREKEREKGVLVLQLRFRPSFYKHRSGLFLHIFCMKEKGNWICVGLIDVWTLWIHLFPYDERG